MSSAASTKDPSRVARGRLGAVKRWGEAGRIVRIDDLSPEMAKLVRLLVETAKAETAEAEARR